MAEGPKRASRAYAGRTLVHEVGSGKSYRTSVIYSPAQADMLVSLARANGMTLTAVVDAILNRVSFDEQGRAVILGGLLEELAPIDTQLTLDHVAVGDPQIRTETPIQGAA